MLSREEIIERIGIARHNAGLSAKALSELAGLNKGYINRLENGKDFLPSLEALLNIIDACGISEEQFFYHDINTYKQDMELIKSMKNLSNEKKLAIATGAAIILIHFLNLPSLPCGAVSTILPIVISVKASTSLDTRNIVPTTAGFIPHTCV